MTMRVRTQNDLTWQQVRDRYLLFKQAQGLSERTIEDARYHVTLFFERTGIHLGDWGQAGDTGVACS
jgi:hypothetical protein